MSGGQDPVSGGQDPLGGAGSSPASMHSGLRQNSSSWPDFWETERAQRSRRSVLTAFKRRRAAPQGRSPCSRGRVCMRREEKPEEPDHRSTDHRFWPAEALAHRAHQLLDQGSPTFNARPPGPGSCHGLRALVHRLEHPPATCRGFEFVPSREGSHDPSQLLK